MTTRFVSLPVLLRTRKLKLEPIKGDGNCFYRAVATGYYRDPEMHFMLRRALMEHMSNSIENYAIFFDSVAKFSRIITANKRKGVWNSDLCDIVPLAVSELLNIRVEVFSVVDDKVIWYVFGEDKPSTLRLLHQENHYDLLKK